MNQDRLKIQLQRLKAEQRAKARKRKLLEDSIKINPNKFEDKLSAVKTTQKADKDLFASAIRTLMKKNK